LRDQSGDDSSLGSRQPFAAAEFPRLRRRAFHVAVPSGASRSRQRADRRDRSALFRSENRFSSAGFCAVFGFRGSRRRSRSRPTCSRSAAASLKPQNVALLHAGHGGRNIAIAGDERLTNPTHVSLLPARCGLASSVPRRRPAKLLQLKQFPTELPHGAAPSTERSARRSG
jgi:hypothetical protein